MEELQVALKIVLANTYVMYFKAHGFHWNLEGNVFPEYHTFFENIYTEVYGAVDDIAERIRVLETYAPANMATLSQMSTITEGDICGTLVKDMLENLQKANESVIESLNAAHKLAEDAKQFGIVNKLEERLDMHNKHAWMIRSTLKGTSL